LSLQLKPKVEVFITPGEVQRGQMFSVQATIFDRNTGMEMPFDKIYMQIIDNKGVEIWPVSTVAENTNRIDKLISTGQMRTGKYLIRVSPSKKFSPMGVAPFKIKSTLPVAAIPLIPAAILATTSSTKKEKIETTFLEPKTPKITWLIWQTEKDSRVCPICLNFAGLVFRADDPTLPRPDPPELGGDTHWGCRCHYDFITQDMEFERAMDEFHAHMDAVYEAAEIAEVAMVAMQVMPRLRK
jgi:hypothetical protein